jgi:hypothetical protein
VSSCNRVEVYAEVASFHGGVSAISDLLARHSGVPPDAAAAAPARLRAGSSRVCRQGTDCRSHAADSVRWDAAGSRGSVGASLIKVTTRRRLLLSRRRAGTPDGAPASGSHSA